MGDRSTRKRVEMATVFHDLARELQTGTKFMRGFLFQFGGTPAKDTTTVLGKETDPSPVTLRLMKAPERDTLSPKGEGCLFSSMKNVETRVGAHRAPLQFVPACIEGPRGAPEAS